MTMECSKEREKKGKGKGKGKKQNCRSEHDGGYGDGTVHSCLGHVKAR